MEKFNLNSFAIGWLSGVGTALVLALFGLTIASLLTGGN